MSDPLTILVVLGSVRRDRVGDRLAKHLVSTIEARGQRVDLLDPMETRLPLLDRMFKEYSQGEAPAPLASVSRRIVAVDSVVVVSAEYNHGIPPALKNLLDHFLEEWFGKPVGIATYSVGRYGGVRAAMQLRMTLPELGMPTISTLLPVPLIDDALEPDGSGAPDWLAEATTNFLSELEWWSDAARAKRKASGRGPI